MSIAQGINKVTVIKKQSGLGAAASGSGGQILRRESSANNLTKDTYQNNEIVDHQQSTGITHGLRKVQADLKGILSPGTYSTVLASILRAPFAATTPYAAGIDVVASPTGPQFVDASGGFLTAGLKIGDVGRWTGFAGGSATTNNARNFLITGLTATNMTGVFLDGTAVVADTAGDSVTFTVVGKKCKAPLTSHTQEYWTVEDWQSDISKSQLYTDVVFSTADIGLPSTGNATIGIGGPGLNRTLGSSQVLTTPTAATTTNPLAAINGYLIVNGTQATYVTGVSLKIDGKASVMGAVVGSNVSPDIQRGRIEVTGQFTALYQDDVLSAVFDAGTDISLIAVVTDSSAATADFVTFSMSAITVSSDTKDDGEKGITKTFAFTARLNSAGGASLANDQTILTIQDSQAA